jgi:hypothetical protein
MSAARDDKYRCITEHETPFGYWWRYTHAQDEPDVTLKAATMVAVNVARNEARKRGKPISWRRPRNPKRPSMFSPAITPMRETRPST